MVTSDIRHILSAQSRYATRVSDAHRCRYLTGTLGYHTIRLLVNPTEADAILSEIRKMVSTVLRPGYQKIGDDEMLNGRAGFLASLLTIKIESGGSGMGAFGKNEIGSILNAIVKSGREYSRAHNSPSKLMYQWHGDEYLGAAHGLSGILQMLMSYWDLLDFEAKADVRQSVDWFLSIQLEDGNFPSGMDRIGRHEELVHWCHGATGAIQMLLVAHLVLQDPKYLAAARKCADLIWTKGILRKGPGICHGVAGSGYAQLLLHRHTGETALLDRAKAFALVMMSQSFQEQARTPDSPWSLFEGWAGALCFLADLLQPSKAQFPLVPIPFPEGLA